MHRAAVATAEAVSGCGIFASEYSPVSFRLEPVYFVGHSRASQTDRVAYPVRRSSQEIHTFLDELMQRQFPGGVTIKEPTKNWSGDTMSFTFRVKKSFLGTSIMGTVRVDDKLIVMDMDVPGVVLLFISEDKISEVINRQLDKLFTVSA